MGLLGVATADGSSAVVWQATTGYSMTRRCAMAVISGVPELAPRRRLLYSRNSQQMGIPGMERSVDVQPAAHAPSGAPLVLIGARVLPLPRLA